ncbi:Arm DNA-binding domain-containing protein [Pantoea sp. CCBC3-3-1]|uniref:Arm DNA-binding domain-containing protein n=1 Tax=Pantoea sp. CCBC3-3-1 TaxID=2490851 RepID=UPI0011BD913D|nr:DUF3596 domain-containing protein [Pantoea sp. CCBC3-3-1]
MTKYPTGVAPNKGHLRIWFMYRGSRRWETLGVLDTPKNRKMAGEMRNNIVYQIKTGVFDYRSSFPESRIFKNESVAQDTVVTLRAIADTWLKLKKPELAHSSYKAYERRIRVTIEMMGENLNIRSVKQEDFLNLRNELLTGYHANGRNYKVRKKGRSVSTVNGSMGDLLALFTFAYSNGYIAANPMANIKPLKKSIKRPDPLTREEYPRFIKACNTRQITNFWTLAIMTGMRHGELCALAWEDIDLVAKTITVARNLTSEGLFTPPKTEASNNRVICLVDGAIHALQDQMEFTRLCPPFAFDFHTREYEERIPDQKTFVFNPSVGAVNGNYGAHYSVDSIGQTWTTTLKRAGLRHRKAYQSRHTYACWSLAAGANPNFVANQMGHTDAQMVYQVYGTWMQENNTEQIAMLNHKLNEFVLQVCSTQKTA